METDLKEKIREDMIQNKGRELSFLESIRFFIVEKYHPLRFILLFRLANHLNDRGGYSDC